MANLQTLTRRARHLAKVNGHRLPRMRTYDTTMLIVRRDAECIDCGKIAWVESGPQVTRNMGGFALVEMCRNWQS